MNSRTIDACLTERLRWARKQMLRLNALIALIALPAAAAVPWPTAEPEEQGFDRALLRKFQESLAAKGTQTLLVARDGVIIWEWYGADGGAEVKHYTASLAKAIVGGTSLMLALADQRMKPDDLAAVYIPAWKSDPRKARITIRHLATHTSGVEDAEQDDIPHMQLPGWKGAFWKRQPDPFSIALGHAPVLFEPGTRFHYSNPGMAALAYAVTAAAGDIGERLRNRILRPAGVDDSAWSIGYGRAYQVDGLPLWANWGGGSFTARATARVGQVMLNGGRWEGRQLVPARWVETMARYAGMPAPERKQGSRSPASGLCWWVNHDGVWTGVPRDAFAGAGAGHQLLLVVPSLRLVAVRNGAALPGPSYWQAAYEHFLSPLMTALAASDEPPYPQSTAIRRITFAPESTIRREAIESDNWPITWGDDNHQYTSYGDGFGFQPFIEKKLGQGFARIIGGPEDFRGENIRSETGERLGDGKASPKASGMVMVDGVLYAWIRNTGNSQLAWSDDHARTWHWGFRLDTSFGSPAFLNFGRNYAGARDRYVYFYSQDGPSAYEIDNGLVMGRVPKDRLRDRSAYEFFERLDGQGRPVWTADIARRGPVFQWKGHCQRVDAVYHPGLRRYLLALAYNHAGGWGIFDAPEPWGPWTRAFHTNDWGLGPTHGYRLPAKWIDGNTMYLIFSGARTPERNFDAFSVRKMMLETATRR